MTERRREWLLIVGVVGASIAAGMLASFFGIDLIPTGR
ncbi:hypothetical protein LCGC14_0355000 [marine sediment metagenome]|uniref:Uncharacterized protein n=1 Tax=marine sediment metagenome TaxID=412755 RepID=A0A0F9T9P1_9ZZZZ